MLISLLACLNPKSCMDRHRDPRQDPKEQADTSLMPSGVKETLLPPNSSRAPQASSTPATGQA